MQDRELLITELSESRARLQIVNSQLYELTLQRLGWTDCIKGLQELLRRCQTEDTKKAKEQAETEKKVNLEEKK